MPELDRLLPGQLIAERYRVGEFVGRGATGVVYSGEHVRVGRRVAIKVLTHAWSNEATVRERFEAEARAASAAGHPNVIQVLDVGELADRRLYSVMEFVDGTDLYSLLWASGPLAPARACRLIRDVAFGVRAAHARGVIHRDLKLENVMVASLPEGEMVKVLDFGIAAGVITTTRATVSGMALGTPEYMAPEQVDGKPPSVAFDIYALGVMLFELLTKRLPIADDNPLRLMARKGHEPAPRATELRPELPAALDQLIADCLDVDPARRPASCDVFLERLTPVLQALESMPTAAGTRTLVAEAGTPPPRPSRWTRPYVERSGAVSSVRVAGQTKTSSERREPSPSLSRWPWLLGVPVVAAVIGLGWFGVFGDRGPSVVEATELAGSGPKPEPSPEIREPESRLGEVQPGVEQGPAQPLGPEPASASQAAAPVVEAPASAIALDKAAARPSETARCEQLRARALEARRIHDWEGVLSATRERECWARARDRKKLETQAYMELGRFADCLRVGEHLNDTEAKKWVTLCSKRLAG